MGRSHRNLSIVYCLPYSMTDSRREIYFLATAVGVIAGLCGAGFHFTLDQALVWRERLPMLTQHCPIPGWLFTMVLGAGMVWLARYLVGHFASEAAGSGIQGIEGVLKGVRPLRLGAASQVHQRLACHCRGSGAGS
ncbi:MAG: hypothetical protein V1766_06345 [Pseudomonadota bacterium]